MLLQPVSVVSFTGLKIRETVISAGGHSRFKKGFSFGMKHNYSGVKDVLDNPYDDITNGSVRIVLSIKWQENSE